MFITWSADVLARYPEFDKLPGVSSGSTAASATIYEHVIKAEAYITSRLAGKFSTPFSSNNATAADLAVDALYVQTQMTRQPEKATALKDWLEQRIEALLSGESSMVADDGTIAGTIVGEPVWSSTMDYHPSFGMGDPLTWEVSSAQKIDEDEARGHVPGDSL